MDDNNERHYCPYEDCTKAFSNSKNLRRHVKAIHREPDDYTCNYCLKHLASKQNLRQHIYLHTGERPYVCSYPGCNKTFRQGSQFSTHKRSHLPPAEASAAVRSATQRPSLLRSRSGGLLEGVTRQAAEPDAISLPQISENRQAMGSLPAFSSLFS